MRANYDRLFAPAAVDGRSNPLHLERGAYLAAARDRALATARLNGVEHIDVAFPDGAGFAPTPHPRVGARCRRRRGRRPASQRTGGRRRRGAAGAGGDSCVRNGGRGVPGAARVPAGPADAPRRRARVRSARGGRSARRRLADRRKRLPQQRRAGAPVRRPSRPQMGRTARQVAPSPRHGAGSRAGERVRLAGVARCGLPLRAALQLGAVALRLHAQRRLHLGRLWRRRPRGHAVVRPRSLHRSDRRRVAALERLRRSACGAALCRVRLQPVCRLPGRRAGDRAVHAGHRALARSRRIRSTRDRRSTRRAT